MSATCSYCRICGHTPKTANDTPNQTRKFWCPDDGWKIGALCPYCWEEVEHAQPKPTDYAYASTNGIADDVDTDEDPTAYID